MENIISRPLLNTLNTNYNPTKSKKEWDIKIGNRYLTIDKSTAKWAYFTILMVSVILPIIIMADGIDSMATYQYIMSGAFDTKNGGDIAFNQMVSDWVSWFFKRVLPLVSNVAISMMVLAIAATIAYLSNQPFWDEVHYLVRQRKKKKYEKNSSGGFLMNNFALIKTAQEMGIGAAIKSYLPDMKGWAFYASLEAGDDGRPSMATYFKSTFPKHVAIMGMLMLLNSRVLLDLYARGGEIMLYFGSKAAYNYDYPMILEKIINRGKDYNPHFDGKDTPSRNKRKVFNAMYSSLKASDSTIEGNTTEQKALRGRALRDWITTDPAWQRVPWDRKSFGIKASIEPTAPANYGAGEGEGSILLAKPLSDFGVPTTEATGYLVAYITTEDNAINLSGTATTEDALAWSGSLGGTLTYDLDQSTLFAPYLARDKNAKPVATSCRVQVNKAINSGRGGYEIDCSSFTKVQGHKISINVGGALKNAGADPNTVYKVVLGVKANNKSDNTSQTRTYVNPQMVSQGTTKSQTLGGTATPNK